MPTNDSTAQTKPGHSPVYWIVFAAFVLLAALLVFFVGWLPRHKQSQEIDKDAAARKNALPRVQVMRVATSPSESNLVVPGTTQAYTEANLYARASGYLSKRLADIGDRVHAGQLLAIIDAPDLDRQVAQARSTLRQSESNLVQLEAQLHLSSLNWDRYKVLVARGVFSRQDGDTQEANFRVADANARAAQSTIQANRDSLDRLLVLQRYERVTAPFDGVVTARNVDVGTLITAQGTGVPSSSSDTLPGTTQAGAQGNNAGSSGSVSSQTAPSTGGAQGGALFAVAQVDRFRVLVSVPEAYSGIVRTGQHATLALQEVPNEKFTGIVTRTSASIDQNTRTLLVEVQVRNRHGVLMPGMYAQVNFIQSNDVPSILIPGETIVVRDGRNVVALVRDQVVHFQPVSIGRDYGEKAEITNGLKPGDVIALNVSDEVHEGAKIQPEFGNAPGASGGQQPGAPGAYGNENLANQGSRQESGGAKGNKSGGGKGSSAGKKKP